MEDRVEVPVEPTEAMLDAAIEASPLWLSATDPERTKRFYVRERASISTDDAQAIYAAMLSARPVSLGGGDSQGSFSPKSENPHRAEDGAVLARPTGVRLEGRMDGPNPMMRVIVERADGTEFEIIQDNGTIISHWARIP